MSSSALVGDGGERTFGLRRVPATCDEQVQRRRAVRVAYRRRRTLRLSCVVESRIGKHEI
jgi:hypothetical protein